MFIKNFKALIYIILFLFIINLLLPIYSFAFNDDSIYVWSDASSSISTSTVPSTDESNQNNSR